MSGRHMSGRQVSINDWGVRCPKMSGALSVQASSVWGVRCPIFVLGVKCPKLVGRHMSKIVKASYVQASGVQKLFWASCV